jgi:hypothetical protein
MGRYALRANIDATPDQLANALRAIAHHVENDHDLDAGGLIVDTIHAGEETGTSWSVRVTHHADALQGANP